MTIINSDDSDKNHTYILKICHLAVSTRSIDDGAQRGHYLGQLVGATGIKLPLYPPPKTMARERGMGVDVCKTGRKAWLRDEGRNFEQDGSPMHARIK